MNNIFTPLPLYFTSIHPTSCHRNILVPIPLFVQFHSTIAIVLLRLSNFWPTCSTYSSPDIILSGGREVLSSFPPRFHRSYISNTNRRFISDGEKRCIADPVVFGLNKIENFPLPHPGWWDLEFPPSADRKWNWISSLHAYFFFFFFLQPHEKKNGVIEFYRERRKSL